ncbi:MAG: hypothetical protein ABIK73_08670 [candidate division WOR-3 bacterium]
MLESVKLNLKLVMANWKAEIAKAQEKAVVANYLLSTDPIKLIVLAFLAMTAIIADAIFTALVLLRGGIELNPISDFLINGDPRLFGITGFHSYLLHQTVLAYVLFFGTIIYTTAVIIANSYATKETTKNAERIRKFSILLKNVLIWALAIRGFCAVWNWLILNGVSL